MAGLCKTDVGLGGRSVGTEPRCCSKGGAGGGGQEKEDATDKRGF